MATDERDAEGGATRRPVLDAEILESLWSLVGDDSDALRDVVTAFVEDGPERIREIRAGILGQDHELVRRAAHTLKSNGLTFGAVDLAAACRALEELARGGRLDGASTIASRIDAEWQRALPAIEELAG